ncbi:MAG: MBL fold metallo-hydrolase [Pseudomonadales bacterium]|nr:MBL fold metallo-hydrolase [Pseudomonadales bacterium]NRA14573.1 MBL fold metallo-hydrolase [Oceanospirillaceae bacterium]
MYSIKNSFVFVVTCLMLFMSLTANAKQAEHITKVADNVYAYGNPAAGYTSMFIVTDEGVVVLEPVNSTHSKLMFEAIRSVTDQPIKYLLHSHNHWDHSGGGQVFRDQGASILAHEEAVAWMRANPHPDMALPNQSWSGKRKDIHLGGTTIELHYLGMNHGLGMTVFRLPKEKIVFIADIVTPDRLLFTIVPDFNIKQWVRSLEEIEAMDFTTAVFTHGKVIGSKKDVAANREFIQDLRGAIHAEFKKGTNPFIIPNIIKLPKYESWAMYDEWLTMNAWRILLDDHMGPFPWRAED